MRCPTCQHDNPDDQSFCAECGRRLAGPIADRSTPATGALPQQTLLQDRYLITGRLGQGGMGAVYRAADRRLSTVTWAIKEMSQSAITGPLEQQQARAAFLHEAEMLAGLNHPNLPRVTDHFEQDGKAYLVMEYVPGETLLSLLLREGLPQPPARALEWFGQLCDVLSYLHRQHPPIIFRDLKPANIMLTPGGQLKLIDFGIARLFKPGQAKDTQAFGTVGYSAPEQYGRGQTDARSDVYALGVLMHQLLTGYDPTLTPFRLPPAHQANPAIPPALSDALARATDSDPDRRFADLHAFQQAVLGAAGPAAAQAPALPPASVAYARPISEHYLQPGSQPVDLPGTQPYGSGLAQATSTGLANSSRWVGGISAAAMGLALLMVGGAAAQGNTSSALAGIGYIMAFAPLVGAPVGVILGILALVQPQTAKSLNGRRHAIIGIAAGLAALLLCCAIGILAGSFNATKG
ncbi:MAG: protein kinase [Kouleothrix sp.]|jgi:serine/threonine-protein kinase|nr:protein kinase [Kouleothrix sp.]